MEPKLPVSRASLVKDETRFRGRSRSSDPSSQYQNLTWHSGRLEAEPESSEQREQK
jgi:hypothetical protein